MSFPTEVNLSAKYDPNLPGNIALSAAASVSGSKAFIWHRSSKFSINSTFELPAFGSHVNSSIGTKIIMRYDDDTSTYVPPALPVEWQERPGEPYEVVKLDARTVKGLDFIEYIADTIIEQENNLRSRLGKELVSMAVEARRTSLEEYAIVISMKMTYETDDFYENNPDINFTPVLQGFASVGIQLGVSGGIEYRYPILFGFPTSKGTIGSIGTSFPFTSAVKVFDTFAQGLLTDTATQTGWNVNHQAWAYAGMNNTGFFIDTNTKYFRGNFFEYHYASQARSIFQVRSSKDIVGIVYDPVKFKYTIVDTLGTTLLNITFNETILNDGRMTGNSWLVSQFNYIKNEGLVQFVLPSWSGDFPEMEIEWEFGDFEIFETNLIYTYANGTSYLLGSATATILVGRGYDLGNFPAVLRESTYDYIKSFRGNTVSLLSPKAGVFSFE